MKHFNLKSFNIISSALIFSFICGCENYRNTQPSINTLQSFDKKNYLLINIFFSSIVRQIGTDSSFVIEYRTKDKKLHFNHIDSLGVGMGYFEPAFKIDKEEEKFLKETIVGDIFYNKECDCFSAKMFSFKNYDKTVQLYVYNSKDTSNKHNFIGEKLFEQGNRLYVWVDAW